MAKRALRPYEPDRPLPLPPDLRQWLPPGHLAYLLSDIVDQAVHGDDERAKIHGAPSLPLCRCITAQRSEGRSLMQASESFTSRLSEMR